MTEPIESTTSQSMEIGDKIIAPYKKFTWLDRILWRLFRYEMKRKPEMREYIVTDTNADQGSR